VKARPLSPELAARLLAIAERRLAPAEFEAARRVPIGDAERENILSLITWFKRRYPTPADRLAYIRRAYATWKRTSPPG